MALNGYFNVTFICHKDERSTPGFPWDAANGAALTALVTALDGISLATIGPQFIIDRTEHSAGSAAVPPGTASRGKKYILKYRDNVLNKTHQIEIPGGDDGLLAEGSDLLDLGVNPGLAVKTAFEAAVVSPAGNPTTLYAIDFTTRQGS